MSKDQLLGQEKRIKPFTKGFETLSQDCASLAEFLLVNGKVRRATEQVLKACEYQELADELKRPATYIQNEE